MATLDKDDLNAISNLIDARINYAIENKLEQVLDEKLAPYPTKSEFFEETARLYTKMEDMETEKAILSAHSSDHSDRLEKLEKIHPHYKHSSV